MDGPGARTFLPQDGAWVQVTSIDLSSARDMRHKTTEAYGGEFLLSGGDQAAKALLHKPVTALVMHGSIAQDVRSALASSAKVYAHVGGSTASATDLVQYAVAVSTSSFAFLGECEHRVLTAPLPTMFGDRAQSVVDSMIGATKAELTALFSTTSPAA
ncbi:MAG: hypothetical protein QOG99_782 [Frankiales bacterium]|nr:hypothetical protein [Frankiales bacterium]